MEFVLVRWVAALWAATQAFSNGFDACIAVAMKSGNTHFSELLGAMTEGGDYRRYAPLAAAAPAWAPLVSLAAAMLFLVAMFQILRRSRAAAEVFTTALALSAGPWILSLGEPATLAAFSTAHLQRDGLIYVLTGLLAVALWRDRRMQAHRI
jgi:hypothetical protein